MKKILLVLLILIISSTIFARPIKRIKFSKGSTKTTVTSYLNGYKDSQTYLIKVKKGQILVLKANKYVSLFITDPNGDDVSDMDLSCHSNQKIKNTIAGDYKVKAVQCQKADEWKGSFKLSVTAK